MGLISRVSSRTYRNFSNFSYFCSNTKTIMKFLSLFALVGLTLAGDYEKEDGVLVLTNDNFADAVAEFDFLLAEFYAPWCGHCKSLAPEYAKAAQKLADQENVALAKIDATVESDLAKKYGVRGYPTLKWFKKDPENAMEYGGGRKEPEIVSWINKKTGPAALDLADVDAANKFKSDNEVNVIGYFPEGSDSADFIAAAEKIDDVPFAITANADVAKELDRLKVVSLCSKLLMKDSTSTLKVIWSLLLKKTCWLMLLNFLIKPLLRSSVATSKNTSSSSPLPPAPTTKNNTVPSPPLPKPTKVKLSSSLSTVTNPITAESWNSLVLKKKTVPPSE